MTARRLDGTEIARQMREDLKGRIAELGAGESAPASG